MKNASLATLEKMLEPLPEAAQQRIVEHPREYIEEMRSISGKKTAPLPFYCLAIAFTAGYRYAQDRYRASQTGNPRQLLNK